MLKLEKINKIYKSKRGSSCHALKDASLSLGDKGMYFILGKSGSGKSTLLNVIGGLDRADSGEIYYNGKALSSFKNRELESYRNNVIGFIFQEYNLIDNFNVFSNVSLALSLQSNTDKTETERRVKAALATVELEGYENREVGELSGGQQQRVAIARAIVKDSKIILADEPTGNLDSQTGRDIFEILKNLSKEKLVIIVSHDRESAEAYGDGIIEIKDGVVEPCEKVIYQENQGQENPPELKRTKLRFKYIAGFALGNLARKKFKTALTILSTIIMVIFICGMHVFYTINANRNISVSAKEMGVQYFSMRQEKTSDTGLTNYMVDIEDYNLYSDMQKLSGVKTFAGYESALPLITERIAVVDLSEETPKTMHIDLQKVVYIIDDLSDLTEAGLKLYGNAKAVDKGGVYLSDFAIKLLLNFSHKFSDGTTDFNQMAGKTLLIMDNKSAITAELKINGVIDTGLIPLWESAPEWSNSLLAFATSEKLTVSQTNALLELGGAAFMSADTYIECGYAPALNNSSFLSSYSNFETVLKSSSAEVSFYRLRNLQEIEGYVNPSTNNTVVLTENGAIFAKTQPISLNSGANEILLPVNTYNALFPDDIIEYDSTASETEWAKITPKHLGERVTPIIRRNSVDKNLLLLGEQKIVGVIISTVFENAVDIVAYIENSVELKDLDRDTVLYANNYNALVVGGEAKAMENALNFLDGYHLKIVNSSYFADIFYMVDRVMKEVATIFLILFLLSALVSVLLLINLISFGVAARKREIGVLKALGTANFDLKKIFLFEALLLGGVALLIGGIGTIWLVDFANTLTLSYVEGMTFFVLTPVTYLLMAAMTVLVMPILALLPLSSITRLDPVKAVKNK